MLDGDLWRPRPGFEVASFFQSEHEASVANHRTFLQPFQNAFLYALQRDPTVSPVDTCKKCSTA